MVQRPARKKGRSAASRRPSTAQSSEAARLRREAARRSPSASSQGGAGGSSSAAARVGARDQDLPPHDRGPVRAFVRDVVDARRRLVGMFLPVSGVVVICSVSRASDLQRSVLLGSLALLGVVLVDAVLLGVEVTRAARARFPDESVPGLATGWYAFLRAHRPRASRRPPARVGPGAGPRPGR
jgi:hypothetical protein